MSYRMQKNTIIEIKLAAWAVAEINRRWAAKGNGKQLSSQNVKCTFEQLCLMTGGLIKRGENPLWPFDNRRADGTMNGDYRIKVNGQERKFWMKIIVPDTDTCTLYLPVAIEVYYNEHFRK